MTGLDSRYKLNISCEIIQTTADGGYTGHQLRVQEQTVLNVSNFLELAQVLGRFHDLAEAIKAEQE